MTGKDASPLEEGAMQQPGEESGPRATERQSTDSESVRLVGATVLLGARGILRIEHRGEVYTLRITRNDRLILTK